jgi:L-seryl-tRNA(Ser) seleniumtransferase
MADPLSALPAVHRLLAHPPVAEAARRHGHVRAREAARAVLAAARSGARRGEGVPALEELGDAVLTRLAQETLPAYPEVINATGVLIHTNLGRAPRRGATLPPYLALEYALEEGTRGERLAPVLERLVRYFGAEAAMVVTNNAAALVLLLASHAAGRDVIVSRGELIEIGGSFRLPEIMAAAGAHLVEVGCTNRTHLGDYERAINDNTAAILVVHRSNFHLEGFVAAPPLAELAAAAGRRGLPVWVDQGSGCHTDLTPFGLRREETVGDLLRQGADVVLFSGDKLLGGPQAGILVGSARTLGPLRRHPLRRALRPDKSALAALAATLDAYLAERPADVPLYRLLATSEDELRRRSRRLARRLRQGGVACRAVSCRAVLGGGTTPDQTLPSWGLELTGEEETAAALRRVTPPVVARTEASRVILDLRAVFPDQDAALARAVAAALRPA